MNELLTEAIERIEHGRAHLKRHFKRNEIRGKAVYIYHMAGLEAGAAVHELSAQLHRFSHYVSNKHGFWLQEQCDIFDFREDVEEFSKKG